MDFLKRAKELKNEIIESRRYFHQTAEVGLDMPMAQEYVIKKLKEYGLHPEKCGHGVTALLGKGAPVLLLRADMDALPMEEDSGETFACRTGHAHACGHDFHAAMLLGAAKLLKECESELKGTVKFMFQPAEETFEGSRDMIANGILQDPPVDAALAFHVAPGKMGPGLFMYNAGGVMMNSVDGFHIDIKGKGGHGAYPNLAVDPLRIAARIYAGLEELIAREANPEKTCVLTVGQIHGGNAANIIPDTAFMEGTLRTNDKAEREMLVRRIKETAEGAAKMCGGSVTITKLSEVPPLMCDRELTEAMAGYMKELGILHPIADMKANASEDFAVIAEQVPSVFMYLSAGFEDERGNYSAHNPKVRFNEDVIPIGMAGLAHCAVRWLEEALCSKEEAQREND
ncbi:MAG: M20 family metallopeptidase [Eubacteriales bacterium]|nr:M20 family metallopeptidase [Eubacteriales bacterium]